MPLADQNKLDAQLKTARREAEERDAQKRAQELKLPYIDMRPFPVQPHALGLIDEQEARKARVAAVELRNKDVVLAVFDPSDEKTKGVVASLQQQGYVVRPHICALGALDIAWQSYQFVRKKGERITGEVAISADELERLQKELSSTEEVAKRLGGGEIKDTTKLFETVLSGALATHASDIHLEPAETNGRLRYRIDGELSDIAALSKETYHALISRIKLLSTLKLNISTEPQDGRFTIKIAAKNVEIRTSLIPSEYGEVAVLRVLDPDAIKGEVGDLGFRAEDMEIVQRALKQPNGMILNTGPTGSGKTTTLYAFIRHIYAPEIKVITIEDPIEYHLDGISQTQVDPKSNYTFASGLRSILRQDPDVILVGEVRDLETAEIGMHAALTGHVVFSTLHTNEAAGAIPRLIDMGVKPQIMGPALNLIIAQRLVRKLCPHCKQPLPVDEALREKVAGLISHLPDRIHAPEIDALTPHQPKKEGCEGCRGGYRGRMGIFELFVVNEEIKELMHANASDQELKKIAIAHGMLTMQQDGILKALEGETSFEEVERVTGPLVFS